uniref:Uncharacterized protein n=1 Tax=Oryza nivara TaxID=4536 RepID=A0A0E0ITK8_ORYNI
MTREVAMNLRSTR